MEGADLPQSIKSTVKLEELTITYLPTVLTTYLPTYQTYSYTSIIKERTWAILDPSKIHDSITVLLRKLVRIIPKSVIQ